MIHLPGRFRGRWVSNECVRFWGFSRRRALPQCRRIRVMTRTRSASESESESESASLSWT